MYPLVSAVRYIELNPHTNDINPLEADHKRVIAEIEITAFEEERYISFIRGITYLLTYSGKMLVINEMNACSVKGVYLIKVSKKMAKGKAEIIIKRVASPENAETLWLAKDIAIELVALNKPENNIFIFCQPP